MKLLSPAQMRQADADAIHRLGIPSLTLMQNASKAVAEETEQAFGPLAGKRVVAVCAKGNNGGDGFGAASFCAKMGAKVTVLLAALPEEITGDAATMLERLPTGVPVLPFEEGKAALRGADLVIDALFGTGLSGTPRGVAAEAIRAINECGANVVAVDLPSGLLGAVGTAPGEVVQADLTVTFCREKYAHWLQPGRHLCGRVVLRDIGIPDECVERQNPLVEGYTAQHFSTALPRRAVDAHKGSCGKLLLVCGSEGMAGAAALCAGGAMRSGAGLTRLMTARAVYPILAAKLDETMVRPLPCDQDGRLTALAAREILLSGLSYQALLLGCGLGQSEGLRTLCAHLWEKWPAALVVDADGLNNLAASINSLTRRTAPAIVTPHPAELARLLQISTEAVQADRIGSACFFAKEFHAVTVLKGAATVTAAPDGRVFVNSSGNPGMATAGSGDVLCGVVGGMLAAGLDPFEAAAAAVYAHGCAGDAAARALSQYGMVAGDILTHLPGVFREFDQWK